MHEKTSFYQIVKENLQGKWCDGLAMLDLSDQDVTIYNIFSANGKEIRIDEYPILLHEKIFSKVVETDYKQAINQFKINNCDIISPKVSTDEVITFEGYKSIQYGRNVYSHERNGKIIVNDTHHFDNLDEIINSGLISEKEIAGKWLVF
ncbi:hypothetical protein EAI89_05700 [Eubacterium sp. am_0171]|uniref:Uncharacterized protein n=1 Tax=Faecalicatena contorta TaxID=39482 RepID=A0A174BUJ7_9FIRM|nr:MULTISPECIES: hypothetical protein [Clostridia]MSC83206.1 hypothetical protein [Eubacterium sp. BIOML-A1]MSD05694.1 hypothetical protein [Eubacterium sp. BIOML-A2]RYT24587.1 hypothetical protein EAI89_05700 [Eubacterium sp. am_0171]CUO03829.1 Uncharacterised protein [[Eubacterium] contortum] [Faecalicatena contorta]